MIKTFLVLYALSVPIFFLVDMLWLGVLARNFYRARLGEMLEVQWPAAIAFYLIYLMGVTYFATYPAVARDSFVVALTLGALFGFFTYATYDLTNLATLKGWPLSVVFVDILWGTVLGAVVASGAYWLYTLIFA